MIWARNCVRYITYLTLTEKEEGREGDIIIEILQITLKKEVQ